MKSLFGTMLVALSAASLSAQQSSKIAQATVSGTLTDVDGWPVPVADVTIGRARTKTDIAGKFTIVAPIGRAAIVAKRVGYRPFSDSITVATGPQEPLELIVDPVEHVQLPEVRILANSPNARVISRNRALVHGGQSWDETQLAGAGSMTVEQFVDERFTPRAGFASHPSRNRPEIRADGSFSGGYNMSGISGADAGINVFALPRAWAPIPGATSEFANTVPWDDTPSTSGSRSRYAVREDCRGVSCFASGAWIPAVDGCDKAVLVDGVPRQAIVKEIVLAESVRQIDAVEVEGCTTIAIWTKPAGATIEQKK